MKTASTITLTLLVLLVLLVSNRHWVFIQIATLVDIPVLIEKQDEGPNVKWHDDYYTLEWLDSRTVAIGEPLYFQQNINYLIIGDEKAVLFDAGSGLREILPVAEALTEKPITFVPSHFHYDHLGDRLPFDRIAVVDLPHISNRVEDNQLTLHWHEHLGAVEGYSVPTFQVSEWLQPDGEIDLGNRTLQIVYTPGHTNDSISLYDPEADFLFSGDFIAQAPYLAMLPNSSMGDYAQGTDNALATVTKETSIYGAHRMRPPGTPVLTIRDLEDLETALENIRNGSLEPEGLYPASYPVNKDTDFLAEPWPFQNWDVTYPQLSSQVKPGE